jgi:hypothetical protein
MYYRTPGARVACNERQMSFWCKLSVFSGIRSAAAASFTGDPLSMTLFETSIDIFCQSPWSPSTLRSSLIKRPSDARTPILERSRMPFLRPLAVQIAPRIRNLMQELDLPWAAADILARSLKAKWISHAHGRSPRPSRRCFPNCGSISAQLSPIQERPNS